MDQANKIGSLFSAYGGRLIMGLGGAALLILFFIPWHGVTSWQLLGVLSGTEFVRQLFYLVGGAILLAATFLPLPLAFRALVGSCVAAVPLVLSGGGIIGWRGVVAALALLTLPAIYLLGSRLHGSTATRWLAVAGVGAVFCLYLTPMSSTVPLVVVGKMVGSGDVVEVALGLFALMPLVFAGLSLLGLLGRDLTEVGLLLSLLILLWAPVAVLLRGWMVEDTTQLYVALALFSASATASVSLAQLLSLASQTDP